MGSLLKVFSHQSLDPIKNASEANEDDYAAKAAKDTEIAELVNVEEGENFSS